MAWPSSDQRHLRGGQRSKGLWRAMLLFLLLLLVLIVLNVSFCHSPIERPAKSLSTQVAQSARVTIENIAATHNGGVVTLSFDALLSPLAKKSVTLDYQVDTGSRSTTQATEGLTRAQLTFSPGEVRKAVVLTLTSPTHETLTLTLWRITGDASLGGKSVFQITPEDVTPKLKTVQQMRAVVQNRVIVSVTPAGYGHVSGTGLYDKGRVATLRAIPEEGGAFIHWTENGKVVSTDANYRLRVTRNRTVIAHFQKSNAAKAASSKISHPPAAESVVSAQNISPGMEDLGTEKQPRYIKLDAQGKPLSDQSASYSTLPWACVLDRRNGLVWEVKSHDGGLHDRGWTYTWYNPDAASNGGKAGTAGKGKCGNTLAGGCDTEKFVAMVNDTDLCGAKDWRLPTQEELQSLADLSHIKPSIESDYFPNTVPSWYWSGSPVASDKAYAWLIGFYFGYDVWGRKDYTFYARLVRTAKGAAIVTGSSDKGNK